jgi:hypothetical protein
MFQRYTENARRAIFYARFEASQYGSHIIDTEHLLLGLLREDHALAKWFPGEKYFEQEIRAEIERHIARGERISTSIEVPLSADSKKVLLLASETSDRLGLAHVEPVHILIGLLGVETSLAAQILTHRGLKAGPMIAQLESEPGRKYRATARTSGRLNLESFLAELKCQTAEDLIAFFALNAEFIDASGKRWNREETFKGFEALFAPYAKRNATYIVESILTDTPRLFVATILWKNALLASEQRAWTHRMTVILLPEADEWAILLVQVTPVQVEMSAAR